MSKRRELLNKTLAGILTASMAVGLCPVTAFAVTGDQIAMDGTYSATAHVSRTVEDDEDENDWNEYDVTVTLTVSDGKFSNIAVAAGSTYDSENDSYFNKAVSKSKGISTLLTGKAAEESVIEGWDTVSTATRTSQAVKEAALAAIHNAAEAESSEVPETKPTETESESETETETETETESETQSAVNTKDLETVIAKAELLKESNYTAESWTAFTKALTSAKEAFESTEQKTVDEAAEALQKAMEALAVTEKYVVMNVPYTDFYEAYNLTDQAVWEVEEGVDAVSTATTSKFTGTTGLAKGTYNNGTYIMGVTLPVQVSAEDYEKLKTGLTEKDNYYFTVSDSKPDAYSELTINSDGSYSFSKLQNASMSASVSINEVDLNGGYGDYQINLEGVTPGGAITTSTGTVSTTVYGAILKTSEGKAYGMTALENLWFGTRVTHMEIAWSVKGGQGLRRAHGRGDTYYQFDMNGATLSGVTLITSAGLVDIDCNLELPEYYTGDLSALTYAITNDSAELSISGIPEDLQDVAISVSGGLAANAKVENGKVTLTGIPVDGTSYTLTISSSNYPDITRTMSTPISQTQKDALSALIAKAEATTGYDSNADLQEHVAEAEEMIGAADETSYNAATLISELEEKIKATYPTAEATATLKGKELHVELVDISLDKLENPTYKLSYKQGRGSVTLAGGDLTSLNVTIDAEPTVGSEYTLTIISDNYQNITTNVTAEEGVSAPVVDTVDTTKLQSVISEAETLVRDNYTPESWSMFESTLAEAKAVLTEKKDQNSVDAAAKALRQAMEDLAVVSAKPADETDETDETDNNNNSPTSNKDNTTNNNNNNNNSNTTNKNNSTTGTAASNSSGSVRTGDPVNVSGLLAAAVSSIGAGVIGLSLRRKNKKDEDEE